MEYCFAPLEGITGYVFRNAHAACFPGMDRYYSPFLVPHQNRDFASREKKDILPENNPGICLIPQILTNNAQDFLRMSDALASYGYQEINLNLGCPSGTVVTRKKGSGFLPFPEELDAFLDTVCSGFSIRNLKLSVKTRIGWESADEWPHLLEIFRKYPLSELIIHPRLRSDFYSRPIHPEAWEYACATTSLPLCFNGDLRTPEQLLDMESRFPEAKGLMIGRGLLEMPDLVCRKNGTPKASPALLREFHDRILDGYRETVSGERNLLFKMKEFWCYFSANFPGREKELKKLKKVQKLPAYLEITAKLFE